MQKYFQQNSPFTFVKLICISLLPPLAIIFPFWRGWDQLYYLDLGISGIFQILSNWDGPHYLLIAKTFYNSELIGPRLFMALPLEYFYNHFPLYPLLIKITSYFSSFLWSALLVNLLFGILTNIYFYLLIKNYSKSPLWLTFLFTIFPARFWIVRSIIAPETLMLFGIIASFYYFDRKNYFLSIFFGILACLTKFQAIILPIAFFVTYAEYPLLNFFARFSKSFTKFFQKTKDDAKVYYQSTTLLPLFSILGILFVFTYYYFLSGNFLIYFAAQKTNQLTAGLPFAQFDYHSPWASTGWLEDIALYFVALLVLVAKLFHSPKRHYFWFVTLYTLLLILVPQRDITRLAMPILPFFYLIFADFFTQKSVKIAMIVAVIPLYFYSLNFIMSNFAPIADWSLLLR